MSTSKYEHTFTWPSASPQDVVVTGTFDSWSGDTHHLKRVGETFQSSVELEWGQVYEYKYVVDGTWQARDDQDKEWDSQGNMNNVVRVPPQPAHVAQLEVAAHPALDLPNATVITPAADDKPSPVVLSDAPPANKEEVSKAIDEAVAQGGLVAAQAPHSTAPSVNGTVAPHTVDSDLSSTQSVRGADGLAMSAAGSLKEQPSAPAPGELTDAQKIATSANVDATTPKAFNKALEPITSIDAVTIPDTVDLQQQITEQAQHVADEAQALATQGMEQAHVLAGQAATGVAGLVAGVEGLIFGEKQESFAETQTKGLEKVDGTNLSENGTSATDFSLVDDASQASQVSDFQHVPTPPKLESEEPVLVQTPTGHGVAGQSAIAPPIDFSTLPVAPAKPTTALVDNSVSDAQKVTNDPAPAVELARRNVQASSAAAVPETMTSSQISSAPTTSTSTPTPSTTTPASSAPAVPAKDTTVPGGYPSTLSTGASKTAPSSPAKKLKDEEKIRKRKSSLFGKVSRIFSSSKDKESK